MQMRILTPFIMLSSFVCPFFLNALAEIEHVRIPVTISTVSQIQSSILGSSQIQLHTDQEIKHVLRGRIDEENTFYFNGWHIDTSAFSIDKQNKIYTAEISVFRVLDKSSEEELKLNTFTVKGNLQCREATVCELLTGAETLLINQDKALIGKIKIGKTMNDEGKLKISSMKKGGN
jgi:hypothetical protein